MTQVFAHPTPPAFVLALSAVAHPDADPPTRLGPAAWEWRHERGAIRMVTEPLLVLEARWDDASTLLHSPGIEPSVRWAELLRALTAPGMPEEAPLLGHRRIDELTVADLPRTGPMAIRWILPWEGDDAELTCRLRPAVAWCRAALDGPETSDTALRLARALEDRWPHLFGSHALVRALGPAAPARRDSIGWRLDAEPLDLPLSVCLLRERAGSAGRPGALRLSVGIGNPFEVVEEIVAAPTAFLADLHAPAVAGGSDSFDLRVYRVDLAACRTDPVGPPRERPWRSWRIRDLASGRPADWADQLREIAFGGGPEIDCILLPELTLDYVWRDGSNARLFDEPAPADGDALLDDVGHQLERALCAMRYLAAIFTPGA